MTKKLKIEPKEIGVWIVITLSTLIFANARVFGKISTLAISLFVGLVYCRKNILILTPILLLSMVIFEPRWQTVVVALSPAFVFFLAYTIHRKLKKKIKPLFSAIYTIISELPLFFIYGLSLENALWAFVNIAVSAVFTLCCIVVCYLLFIKGLKYKLISIEQIALSLVLLVYSLGLYRLKIDTIYLSSIIFAFFAVFVSYFYSEKGCIATIIVGLGALLSDGNTAAFLFCTVSAVLLLLVKGYRRFSFLVLPTVDLIIGFGFKLVPNYSYINAILLFVGGLVFAVLPNSLINKYLSNIGVERGYAVRTLVNRNRYDLYKRLNKISAVLKDMAVILDGDKEELTEPDENQQFLAKQLAFSMCSTCPKKSECEKMLTAETSAVFYDLIKNAIKSNRVSIMEMPPFLVEYCTKSSRVLTACKEMMDNYIVKKELNDSVNACKTLMIEQINGLSGMICGFANEIKQAVSFDSAKERELIDALSAQNVIASEAVVYRNGESVNLVITVRECDENKAALDKTINKLLGNMVKSDKTYSNGVINLTYVSAPKLDLMSGIAKRSKDGNACGDAHSCIKISPDKVLFAICDGMGTGKKANDTSNRAISLVEAFYKAGIDESIVLTIINKLLSARSGENFSALDIAVIDLRLGIADFIKLGGVESVIKSKESYDIIEGGALPLGILETVKPKVQRKAIKNGDMIIMYSDGITDSIGTDGVIRISEQNKTNNPDTLANVIIDDSEFVGHADDKTVLCIKIFNRI